MGCTNTRILKSGVGVVLDEPTLLLLDAKNKKNPIVAVGDEAKNMSKRTNEYQLVCPMRNGVVVNKDYAKRLLNSFLEKLNEKKLFRGNLLWLVPTSIAPVDKNEFVNLGYALGYKNVDVLPSALASCQELEIDVDNKYAHMIVDMGGDSTNISVVYRGRIVQGCTMSLGGNDIDREIQHYLREVFNMDIDIGFAKNVKERVSSILPNDQLGYHLDLKDDESGVNELSITARELRDIYVGFFAKVCDCISKVAKMCTNDIMGELNRTGVFLAGGLAKMSGVDKFMKARVNIPVYVADRPEFASIFGAEKLINEPEKLNRIIYLNQQ